MLPAPYPILRSPNKGFTRWVRGSAWACTRRGLPCPDCRQSGGALLPHPFTLPCGSEEPIGGLLSVALSLVPSRLNRSFDRAGIGTGGCYPPPCSFVLGLSSHGWGPFMSSRLAASRGDYTMKLCAGSFVFMYHGFMGSTSAMIWAVPEQVEMLAGVLSAGGIGVIGAGCPVSAQTGTVAQGFGCGVQDDLRHMLSSETPDLVLLAAPGGFGHREIEGDLGALQQAHSREVAVATMEPIPGEATVISGTSWGDALHSGAFGEFVRVVPMVRRGRLIDELMATLETFGVIRSMSVSISAPGVFGSLGARVFEAMDLVRTLVGVPEIIDASYQAGGLGGSGSHGLHQLPGQSLRELHGTMTAHLRMGDGRGVLVQVSDQVGRSGLSMTLLGDEGEIRLWDTGFRRLDTTGTVIDSFTMETGDAVDPTIDPSSVRLTEQLIQLCSGVGPVRSPVDHASVLAMGHTALLSARTGQGETPETIRRLLMEV